jgi:predicted RNA binding protein YcfA (HicA-like mRNA interferase family)
MVGGRTRCRGHSRTSPRCGVKIIRGKRMCRVLESRGWHLVRINGSHHIYRDPTTMRQTTVPVHGNDDLKPGTQRAILRDAGLTENDL